MSGARLLFSIRPPGTPLFAMESKMYFGTPTELSLKRG